MSEQRAQAYARGQASILVNRYKAKIQDKIDYLTPENRQSPITLKDYAHPEATPFIIQKDMKEEKDNLLRKVNPLNKKLLLLNADERRAVEAAYKQLTTLIDKEEAKVLNKQMASAGPYVFSREGIYGDDSNEGEGAWAEAIAVSKEERARMDAEQRAAETKSDLPLPDTPPPPYSRLDPNSKRKGGKRKTRRRRKLKKRKTMKKKRLRRKKTMKKRKSRKRRKTKKRRSKRR